MSAIEAFEHVDVLDTKIICQFEDEINRGKRNTFHEKSEGGIILHQNEVTSFDKGTKDPRWCVVVKVGPEVMEDIQPGTRILVTPMMWTRLSRYKGESFVRTEERHVLAIGE